MLFMLYAVLKFGYGFTAFELHILSYCLGVMYDMVNKEKIVKVEAYTETGSLIVSTKTFEFPRDFFSLKNTEFVILKGKMERFIEISEKIDVIFFYLNGTRIMYHTEVDVCTEFQLNFHLGTKYTVLEERRQSYKIDTDIIGKILFYIRDDETVQFDRPLNVAFRNINLGGVFIVATEFEFRVGDLFSLRFLDNPPIEVQTEVLRKQHRSEDGQLDGYGCRFVELSHTDEERIARFIFELQIAERDRRKLAEGK